MRLSLSLSLSLGMSEAHAAPDIRDCDAGDAPSTPVDYASGDCNGRCTYSAGVITCSLLNATDDVNEAWAVQDFNATNNHDFSAWGKIHGDAWCCTIDDESPEVITEFVLLGSEFDGDVLGFQWPGAISCCAADNMKPHSTDDLTGWIHGYDGSGPNAGPKDDDTIWGSDYTGGDYHDLLRGQSGQDLIFGGGGQDSIHGGEGDDEMHGGPQNDRIQGGEGVDVLVGGDGHDTLCDVSDNDARTLMEGGDGNDKFWLEGGGIFGFDTSSTCGDGSDSAGDNTFWSMPNFCETPISTEPATCPAP